MERCPCARTETTATELTGLIGGVVGATTVALLGVDPADATVSATCDALGVTGYGYTEDEAIAMLCQDLAYLWREIAMVPDAELTPAAIEHKRKLREAITIRHERRP